MRIGGWRVIAASNARRIAEVVPPRVCGRVAVRMEREDPKSRESSSGTTWELYDLQGHLLSMLQTMPEAKTSGWQPTFETGRVAHSPLRLGSCISTA